MYKKNNLLSLKSTRVGTKGKKVVEREPMNIGHTAPKNTVHNILVAIALGKWNLIDLKKWRLHPASGVQNLLNVPHKGPCAFANKALE